eukprot:672179-Rhodomonas_salina.4
MCLNLGVVYQPSAQRSAWSCPGDFSAACCLEIGADDAWCGESSGLAAQAMGGKIYAVGGWDRKTDLA